jgi:hypothetical protein
MPLSHRLPAFTAALAGLALAVPTGALAAEQFTGVVDGNQLTTFHSDTIPALSAPVSVDALPGGERLLALDQWGPPTRPGALLALGSSGTLYGLDGPHHRITGTVAGFGAAILPHQAVTLSVGADERTARVIANGRDKVLDLTTGAIVSDVPATGAVAADLGTDGVLRGVDPGAHAVVSLDAAGEHVLAPTGDLQLNNPTSATTAPDGSTWILTQLALRQGAPEQSRLARFDPKTGQLKGVASFLYRRLDAIAANGVVPDDTTAPRATVRVPRQTVGDAIKHRGFLAIVTTDEPGQTVMSARLGKAYRGFGFSTAFKDGQLRVVANERIASIRKLAGKRLRLHLAIHDFAGNTKLVDRSFTLGR